MSFHWFIHFGVFFSCARNKFEPFHTSSHLNIHQNINISWNFANIWFFCFVFYLGIQCIRPNPIFVRFFSIPLPCVLYCSLNCMLFECRICKICAFELVFLFSFHLIKLPIPIYCIYPMCHNLNIGVLFGCFIWLHFSVVCWALNLHSKWIRFVYHTKNRIFLSSNTMR